MSAAPPSNKYIISLPPAPFWSSPDGKTLVAVVVASCMNMWERGVGYIALVGKATDQQMKLNPAKCNCNVEASRSVHNPASLIAMTADP